MSSAGDTKRPRRPKAGFTIIELLMVIAVISLLIGILLPSLRTVGLQSMATVTHARIAELANGARAYYDNHNVYPGQVDRDEWADYTGSQVLAARLFGYKYGDITGTPSVAATTLAPVVDGDLKTLNGSGGKHNSISDRFRIGPMAILYYPSRIGQTGLSQYEWADNEDYKPSEWADQNAFEKYIKDSRFGATNTPYNPGEFLLIGAADRKYGTLDDLKNW